MRITNATLSVTRHASQSWLELLSDALAPAVRMGCYPLRAAITQLDGTEATIECTFVNLDARDPYLERFTRVELAAPRRKDHQDATFAVVQIVPTGVRCEIGGFAGDACPATNLLASAADILITHPNAVNASDINEMAANVLYVEGKSLDDVLLGHLALAPSRSNRIGTFIDPTGRSHLDDVVHTLNAARAVAGIDCGLYAMGSSEIGARTVWSQSGCAVGTVLNPLAIIEACERLLAQGVQAIGGVSVIHGVSAAEFSQHLAGRIPNPSGGVEAIITHLISKIFAVPAAHAPLPYYQDVKERGTHNPRAAAEFISAPHYLSVLKGLARAPRLQPIERLDQLPGHLISLNSVAAIVMPAGCLGGIPALAAELSDIPLIAVEENASLLTVSNDKMRLPNVIPVRSYLEASGVLLALRRGISLESLRRPLSCARRLETPAEPREACA
jgi:hypothetical protein